MCTEALESRLAFHKGIQVKGGEDKAGAWRKLQALWKAPIYVGDAGGLPLSVKTWRLMSLVRTAGETQRVSLSPPVVAIYLGRRKSCKPA
jgi:hypothetical protein